MTVRYHRLTGVLLIVSLLGIASCATLDNINPFADSDPGVRAFYADQQRQGHVQDYRIRVNAPREDFLRLVTETVEELTDSNTNILRVGDREGEGYMSNRPFMRVVTPRIYLDDEDEFQEIFFLGDYLVESPEIQVLAENFYYQVEAILYLQGQDFGVEFNVTGDNEWNIYESTNGNQRKVPKEEHVKYGVGSYRYEETVEMTNWRGNPIEGTEWVYVDIDDSPQSRGNLEEQLRNTFIENAARARITARVY